VGFSPTAHLGVRAAVASGGFLYVGTTSRGEVWRTGDGEQWDLVFAAGIPEGAHGGYVASLTEAGGALYAAVNGRVQRSFDGLSWREVGELTPFTVEAMHEFRGAIYAGTALPPRAWVYRSPVSGTSQRPRAGGLR